jgi:hypothetical protein
MEFDIRKAINSIIHRRKPVSPTDQAIAAHCLMVNDAINSRGLVSKKGIVNTGRILNGEDPSQVIQEHFQQK